MFCTVLKGNMVFVYTPVPFLVAGWVQTTTIVVCTHKYTQEGPTGDQHP